MSVVLVSDRDFDRGLAPDDSRVETSEWLERADGKKGCEFRLLVDCLDAKRCSDAWICAQSARLRRGGSRVLLSTVKGECAKHEMRVAQANGYSKEDDECFWRVRLAPDDRLLRASANESWFSDLVEYAFGAQRTQKVVMWGPPGIGKTLALERLARMRPQGNLRATLFSCTDFDKWEDAAAHLSAAAHRFGKQSVLLIDDLDVLHDGDCASMRAKLFELVATQLQCRCVLVTNDWYARENWPLRSGKLKQNFAHMRVHRVQRAALRAHLQAHYPLLSTANHRESLEALLDEANGDVRAALIGAELEQRLCEGGGSGSGSLEGSMARDLRSQQALHYSIWKCARDSTPRLALNVLHADDDTDDVGQVVFANAPRIVDDRSEQLSLDALADAADCHSLAALYDEQRRESGYAGKNAMQEDKQIHFALNCALPLGMLVATAGVRRTLNERLQLEFPTRVTAKAQREKAPALARLGQHVRMSAALGAKRAAEQRGINDDGVLVAKRVFRPVRPDDALLRFAVQSSVLASANASTLSAELKQRGKTSEQVSALLRRAAALGCDVEDVLFLCQLAYGANASSVPALSTLQQHWRRAVREQMVVPMLADVVTSGVSKRALGQASTASGGVEKKKKQKSGTTAGKRKRLDRSALKESADGRVRTIGDMFAKIKRSSSAVLQKSDGD